jgi:hypothetical protein
MKLDIKSTTEQLDTPVLFLIFNRPAVTKKVFEQIKLIKPKHLYVAADGPRTNRPDDTKNCYETRKIIDQIDWKCEIKTLFRENNMGCGLAVHSAISWFFDNVEAGIILEDDCLPNLSFFPFCEELLRKYKDDDEVKFIGGNNFQNDIKRGDASYYFSRYPASWGWATWRRSWKLFNADISDSTTQIKSGKLDRIFNSLQEKNHWMKSLAIAQKERDNIWDFQFYYSIWKNNGICITPGKNLVINLGFFDQGTHYFLKDSTKTNVKNETMHFPLKHPGLITVNREADKYMFHHFYSHSKQRALRLLRENNLRTIFTYFKKRFFFIF